MTENQIAALDGDWASFTPAEQAAFRFTRKLTYQPHRLAPEDLQELRAHYKDRQILEILLTVSNNNSTTRWTDALSIPQEDHRTFVTPTDEKFREATSLVAPTGKSAELPVFDARPLLESPEKVVLTLQGIRDRKPVLALVSEEEARKLLKGIWPEDQPVPAWMRLLAHFPKAGVARVQAMLAAQKYGTLEPRLKALVYWTAAREDRAWYALGQARQRLLGLGLTQEELFSLEEKPTKLTDGDRLALMFVRKLTGTPGLMDDADIANLRKYFTDKQVAELVFHTANAAFFNRLTESALLPLESK